MNKKFKSQASSARAASALTGGIGFGPSFQTISSPLAYVTEAPDLSRISKPEVVVSFKNLNKKDSTTKAKALEELQELCSQTETERAILEAWSDIYPRTSIDNSRRVRQLAHTLQGTLTVSSGKRIAPLLPKVVGAWLAGTTDNDKVVARTAQDALRKSFPTPDKRSALWKIYQTAIVEYIEDAVVSQSKSTLSDERTTKPDDAEAKYVRVIGSAIVMLAQLLQHGLSSDVVNDLLNGTLLWKFVHHNDPYLRRAASGLASVAVEKCAAVLEWRSMSLHFLGKGLNADQTGSSLQYTDALIALTKERADLWTADYSNKTPVSVRLSNFLKKGSQYGPEKVWNNICQVIRLIPKIAWLSEERMQSAKTLAESLHIGVSLQSERINASVSWATYIDIVIWLIGLLSSEKKAFAEQNLMPIVVQFVSKTENQHWTMSGSAPRQCALILSGVIRQDCRSAYEDTWKQVVADTVNLMKLSLPESSKAFKQSQETVIAQVARLFAVREELTKLIADLEDAVVVVQQEDIVLLDSAIDLLKSRNGKPYAATAVIESLLKQAAFDRSYRPLQKFIQSDLAGLLNSPSSEKLVSIALNHGFAGIVSDQLRNKTRISVEALSFFLQHVDGSRLESDAKTQILSEIISLKEPTSQNLATAILLNVSLPDLHDQILDRVEESLSGSASEEEQKSTLDWMKNSLLSPSSVLITSSPHRARIISQLLHLSESDASLADEANALIAKLDSQPSHGDSSHSIIQQQFSGQRPLLSIFTLVDLGLAALAKNETNVNQLLPTATQWMQALSPNTQSARPCSLAVSSPLQGMVYMLEAGSGCKDQQSGDPDGLSLAFRLAFYTVKLLSNSLAIDRLKDSSARTSQKYLPIALSLINEKLAMDSANEMWQQSFPDVIQDAADIVIDGNRILQSWIGDSEMLDMWLGKAHQFTDWAVNTYVESLAWIHIATQIVDSSGSSQLMRQYEQEIQTSYRSPKLLCTAALFVVLGESFSASPMGKKILNELVASATQTKTGIKSLILMNLLLQGQSEFLEAVQSQRLVFLMKNLVKLLTQHEITGLQAESMKLLTVIIPHVADIYGEHWEQIIDSLISVWSDDIDIPLMNASLRLYARLQALLHSEDPNEDLQEAIKSSLPRLDSGLLNCLPVLESTNLSVDQPKDITAELLRRQLKPIDAHPDNSLLQYLGSSTQAIQAAVYDIFHRYILQRQEHLSVELVLEPQEVHLADELVDMLTDFSKPRQTLLAWSLVFDHFTSASFMLREQYITDVKNRGDVKGLLGFVCDVLRIADPRPVDGSRIDFKTFDASDSELSDRAIEDLSIYIYYKCLLYLPSLTKEWFIGQKRRVNAPLEKWTQKYISPSIVAASLAGVLEWAGSQSDEERPLQIKTNARSSEVVASIEIDPENPPISLAISLPGAYPLESPAVLSRTRVGVSEKNWQSWLRTFQIIIFSSGSIIEGLIAFRHNVQGALRGQSECAICYSIIGTDKQTPNKKCGTCKNMFHGVCLFRWFKSSNSSSCPLCRNNFNYA